LEKRAHHQRRQQPGNAVNLRKLGVKRQVGARVSTQVIRNSEGKTVTPAAINPFKKNTRTMWLVASRVFGKNQAGKKQLCLLCHLQNM
jgi:hypothetical protein